MPDFTHLVLGSGGLSCLSYLGVLKYLQENDLHSSIRHYYGVSMGAFFGFLFAIGIPYVKIYELLEDAYCHIDDSKYVFPSFSILQSQLGIDKGEQLVEPLKAVYRQIYNERFPKQSYDIEELTFLEFTKHTGATLTVVASRVESEEPTFFSLEETPTLCIWKAIQASMTIPFVFQPTQIGDALYVDGFLTCEFPVPPKTVLPVQSTLGVFLDTRKKQTVQTMQRETVSSANLSAASALKSPSWTLWDYTLRILQTQLFYTKELYAQSKQLKHLLWLSNPPTELLPLKLHANGMTLDLSIQALEAAVAHGYEAAYYYFTSMNLSTNPESVKTSTE